MMRTVGLLVLVGLAQAGTVPSVSAQDPSGVYGYIAFTDPASGTRWVPDRGYPAEIAVVFRSVADGREHRASFINPGCQARFPTACMYEIAFNYTDVETTPTALARSGGATGPSQIQYNPRSWRYDRVEVGPWRFAFGTTSEPLPLSRRATPYADLR
ncbi:MAG TPA: hypothetical protein VH680_15805 [Gemmatimonadales bacterium]|jgi:hypothetical protein